MATERRRSARLLAALPATLLLTLPATVHASSPWWAPLAFSGQRVTAVSAASARVAVTVGPATYLSADAGRSFRTVGAVPTLAEPVAWRWEIRDGSVWVASPGQTPHPDQQAPFLGVSAHLIAGPAALPGVAVAVGSDNHVWRRDASGHWATSFILLPAGGLSGTPQVTAVAAFARPLSAAVYLATAGYGVLVTEDGGDDWIRADPGLPENVLALATDSSQQALYAATDQGLFVHHLQALPAPPAYHDASLFLRWLGIGLVALAATAAAALGLRRSLDG
jgi:hypothetical protein